MSDWYENGVARLLMASVRVLPNWPAKMSHYGECDIDPERADKASGTQQLTGTAYDSGPGDEPIIPVSGLVTRMLRLAPETCQLWGVGEGNVARGFVPCLGRAASSPALHIPAPSHFYPLMRPSQGQGDSGDRKHPSYPDTAPTSAVWGAGMYDRCSQQNPARCVIL